MAARRIDILQLARFNQAMIWPNMRQEQSRRADGRTQGVDMGVALWAASFATVPLAPREARILEAAILSLNGLEGSFLAYDLRNPFPAAYPDGVFDDTGQIDRFGVASDEIEISGLPPGFVLSVSDKFGFSYGSGASLAVHSLMSAGVADGAGVSPLLKVFPAIRPGAAIGAPVSFKKPPCEMALIPNNPPPQQRDTLLTEIAFSGVQVF